MSRANSFSHPLLDRLTQLAQSSLKKVIGSFDHDQLFGFRDRVHQGLEFSSRPKLIARATDQQFRLEAFLQEFVCIYAWLLRIRGHRSNRSTGPNHRLYSRIAARSPHSYGSAERKSRKDKRKVKLRVQPVKRRADIIDFPGTMIVLSLTQARSAKVKPEHRKTERMQSLHRVKHNLVMQRPAKQRMRMANQRGMSRILSPTVQQSLKPPRRTFKEK